MMMDITKFFPKDPAKKKKRKETKFPEAGFEEVLNKGIRHSNPAGAVWESGSDKLLSFSLPSVFKGQSSEKRKELVQDIHDDIENESSEENNSLMIIPVHSELNEDTDVQITGVLTGKKRKLNGNEKQTYENWKKRHFFRPLKNEEQSLQLTLQQRIKKQQNVIEEWKDQLERTKKHMERIENSLQKEEEFLKVLVEKEREAASAREEKEEPIVSNSDCCEASSQAEHSQEEL